MAAELLDVTNESELEAFLGRLVADTARRAGGPLPDGAGRALVTTLRRTAERTLPTLADSLGDATEPADAGPSASETAARVYGLELEGMSAEDRDYEIAHQYVRFAQAATVHAATARVPDPAAAVDAAVAKAGRELAPGLLALEPGAPTGPPAGPWVRRGTDVVLIGVQPPHPSTRVASNPPQDR
jgi:hypothetical protein